MVRVRPTGGGGRGRAPADLHSGAMLPASCILLGLIAVAAHPQAFTYVKPWDPFRRTAVGCEMCYKNDCVVTRGPRCEYYAEASKLVSDNDSDNREEEEVHHEEGDNIDIMLFELVDSASATPYFRGCIPLVSQYTDCTADNICTGCKFCSCTAEGRWICAEKQKCRPEPALDIDHRVIGIVIENLKRKENSSQKRLKRSAIIGNTVPKKYDNKITYTDISKWMYGADALNYEQNNVGVGKILEYLRGTKTTFDENRDLDRDFTSTVTSGLDVTTNMSANDNYVDLLEFNDILRSWTTDEISTTQPFSVINTTQTFTRRDSSQYQHIDDVDYIEYDPVRLIKRDTSKMEINKIPNLLQINTTSNNFSFEQILTDALRGLNKITNEKQKELEELLKIQNNLINIAKTHNISFDSNSTVIRDGYNKHHIAIYNLDTFEKCTANVKCDICNAVEDVLKTNNISSTSALRRDLKLIISSIGKYVFCEKDNKDATRTKFLSPQERDQESRRLIEPLNIYKSISPTIQMRDILTQLNKTPKNSLRALSEQAQKILKRVIKQLYLDDFAVIDFIVHETYYDFDNYLENIGSKWNKMMQDIIDSEIFDTLYRIKLLHLTLKADISKMENMVTLLDFARNRRMTVANGVTIDKSIVRIQNNLQLIDNNVQKIMELGKNKRMRHTSATERSKSTKKKSILQKLKMMFQRSKDDIKDMLRNRFPKSEIMKQIAKKKIDELGNRRMLDYQETMKRWQENLNVSTRRKKRSSWGFQSFADRIKSIIPGYLKGKVRPAIQKKKSHNKTKTTKRHGSKRQRRTNPTTIKTERVTKTN